MVDRDRRNHLQELGPGGECVSTATWNALLAAGVLSVAVVLVMHFAVNIPSADEWSSVIPLVDSAVHGTLTLSELWTQHFNESHLLIPNAIFAAVGVFGSFNTRILILLSAIVQGSDLGCPPCGVQGLLRTGPDDFPGGPSGRRVVRPGDIDNALWGFQIQLSLTQFFVILMLLCMFVSRGRQPWKEWAFAAAMSVGSLRRVPPSRASWHGQWGSWSCCGFAVREHRSIVATC